MKARSTSPESYSSLTREVVRESESPLTFAEILAAVDARKPISTRNPSGTIRTAISATRLVVAVGDGRYGWLPRLITGSVVRLSLERFGTGVPSLQFGDEVRDLLWPGFMDSAAPEHRAPVRLALAEDDEVELSSGAYFGLTTPTFGRDRLKAWLSARRADANTEAGDALILTCVDGLAKRYSLRLERRAERDEAAIAARNREIVAALEGRFRHLRQAPMDIDLYRFLLAAGHYRHSVPPDPLAQVWVREALSDDAPDLAYDYFSHPMYRFNPGVMLSRVAAETEGEEPDALPDHPPRLRDTSQTIGQIYRLKVTLRGSAPPIWRRIEVPADIVLADLHEVLQTVMGWYDAHLHAFERGADHFATPDPDDWEPVHDERVYRLNQLMARKRDRLVYEYDFGDSWEHELALEAIAPPEPGAQYPRCIQGARAAPPEDVGGVWGYRVFLEALADRRHPEHASRLEWYGGPFDPEAFDLARVNRALRPPARPGRVRSPKA